jgi:hypothetical protein
VTTKIGVCARSISPGVAAAFDALAEALNVSFVRRAFTEAEDVDGWIVLGADREFASAIGRAARPCYVVLDEAQLVPAGTSSTIRFANRPELDAVLRGREVTADDAVDTKALPHWLPAALPLAVKDGLPVWAIRAQGDWRVHYVALPPPELNDGEALFDHFGRRRLVRLLPLVLFIRSLADDHLWEPPPLQAAFMFDDANLHWTSYGFIDYGEMVRHGVAANYHVALATIPLDAWFVHSRTSAIFKQNPERISLLYHGNDHIFSELARARSAEAMQRLLRQAVGRMTRMEARTGLDVARVMAPPHNAFSTTALSEMARLGFDAACVSTGSLRDHNRDAAWTRILGMKPCDVVVGLPVIPRFFLTRCCRNNILLSALLRQPIVPMTHHQALADGYDLLDETASFVNSLGEVAWRDMKAISRSLYSRRQIGTSLSVRMWSKRVTVPIPAGTTQLHIEYPWLEPCAAEPLVWRPIATDRPWQVVSRLEPLPVDAGMTIEIACGPLGATRTEAYHVGPRLVPVARRLLTEGRDRAFPPIYRMVRRVQQSRSRLRVRPRNESSTTEDTEETKEHPPPFRIDLRVLSVLRGSPWTERLHRSGPISNVLHKGRRRRSRR